jgi:hypothetical protein
MQIYDGNSRHGYNAWAMAAVLGNGPIGQLEKTMEQRLPPFRFLTVNSACNGLTGVMRTQRPAGTILCPLFASPRSYAAIKHAGHKAAFSDVDEDGNLHPLIAERQLQHTDKVRAILVVASFGSWPDLQNLRQLATSLGVPLIGDFAQGLPSALLAPEYLALCDVVVFSTSPTKWAGLPDGGLVGCQDEGLHYRLVRQTMHPLRQVLQVPDKPPNFYYYDCRMNLRTAVAMLRILDQADTELDLLKSEQAELIAKLEPCRFRQRRPTIYEPLTVLATEPFRSMLPDGLQLSDLPIPDCSGLAQKHNLPETVRQFRYRKVIESA